MAQRPFLVRALPFGLFIGLMVLDPALQAILPEGVDPRWLYAVRSGAALTAILILWTHYEELSATANWTTEAIGLSLVIGTGVFIAWISLDLWPLAFAAGEGFDPRVGNDVHLGLALTRLAGATLVVPIMEELFWRSWLVRWLGHPRFLNVDPGSVGWRAILIGSVLFATEHRLWFAGLLAGVAYAWLYKRTRNLWYPILAHGLTNGLLGLYVLWRGLWVFW